MKHLYVQVNHLNVQVRSAQTNSLLKIPVSLMATFLNFVKVI